MKLQHNCCRYEYSYYYNIGTLEFNLLDGLIRFIIIKVVQYSFFLKPKT